MAFNAIPIIRAVQFCLAIIVLGLSAYVVNWYTTDTLTKSPTQINFLVAAPVISIVSILYSEISSRFVTKLHHVYVVMALDALNAVLYFSGFIALAVFLNGLLFCRGSVCSSARADTAFAAFSWALWTATAGLTAMQTFRPAPRMAKNQSAQMYGAEMKDASNRA